ncbi:MAG: VTT domain-containing protein [Alphaproteobacteria bacterium]
MGDRAIAVEGENCFRVAAADRAAFLIDSDAYYRALKAAVRRARRSIFIIGWDVHSRTPLGFDRSGPGPHFLAALLDNVASAPDGPTVYVLNWDSPLLYAVDRQWVPTLAFDWFTCNKVRFALDASYPVGGSQHQKIVIIDDAMAFVGGIDLTYNRLDDQRHAKDDPRRRNPDGTTYEPQHDVQAALEGDVAATLGAVARERWYRATGERLPPPDPGGDPWPPELDPALNDVEVAVARTYPSWKGFAAVREVERLYLDVIAAARHTIYLENQYLTAERILAALLDRLDAPDGPEIVMVLPHGAHGWLEEVAIVRRQAAAIDRLRQADAHGRFAVFSPHDNDSSIHVHAKLMIVDDRIIRLGSANLANRSMGLDSECDIHIETAAGSEQAAAAAHLCHRLLAEHLGTDADTVAAARREQPSLIAAIELLNDESGRHLAPLRPAPPQADLADTKWLDPDQPIEMERMADEMASGSGDRRSLRGTLLRLAIVVALLLSLAAAWRWGPLSELADPAALEAQLSRLRGDWMVTLAVLAAFVVGGLVMFPVTILILATGLLYGPISGVAVALGGAMAGAVAGYGAGVLLGRHGLRRLLRGRLDRISRQLARRGVLSMTLIRMLPIAPFTVINMVAGASHLRFRDFLLGSLYGMAPGIVAITVFAGQVGEVLRAPSPAKLAILAGIVAVITLAGIWAWRRLVAWRAADTGTD